MNRLWRGRSVTIEGKKLKEVLASLKRDVIDCEVEVSFRRRVATIRRRHPDKAHKTLEKVLAHVGLHIDDFEYIALLSGEAFDPNDDRERLSDRWRA